MFCQTVTRAIAGSAHAGSDNQSGPVIPTRASALLIAPSRGSKTQFQTRPITIGVAIHGTTNSAR
ncbi:hypothetical protein GCM10020219_083740 [Nonomuraea dietziae]